MAVVLRNVTKKGQISYPRVEGQQMDDGTALKIVLEAVNLNLLVQSG